MSDKIAVTKCEQMLDKEAQRVALSILQLVNSINFKASSIEDKPSPELIHFSNKIVHSIKKLITDEVTKQFKISDYEKIR